MLFGIYLIGYLIMIVGLGILHGVTATRQRDP